MKRGNKFWLLIFVVLVIGVLVVLLAFSLDGAVQDWQHRHTLKNIGRSPALDYESDGLALSRLVRPSLCRCRMAKRQSALDQNFSGHDCRRSTRGHLCLRLKATTGRVRPTVSVEKGWARQTFTIGANYQSFPSGHTAFSAGFSHFF